MIWSPAATRNVDAIHRYVASFNPLAAERLRERLIAAGEGLAALPERGRLVRGGRRQLLVAPYLLTYVYADEVAILRVRHGARRRT